MAGDSMSEDAPIQTTSLKKYKNISLRGYTV